MKADCPDAIQALIDAGANIDVWMSEDYKTFSVATLAKYRQIVDLINTHDVEALETFLKDW